MTQKDLILELLVEAGEKGVNSFDLTYKEAIKQAPTRIWELKEQGYEIHSKTEKNTSVTYTLYGLKKANEPIERQGHWDFTTGNARWV